METHTFGASHPFSAFAFSGPLRTLGLPPHFSLEPVFSLHLSADSCPIWPSDPFWSPFFSPSTFLLTFHTLAIGTFSQPLLWPPAPFCLHFFPASNLLLALLYLFSHYFFPRLHFSPPLFFIWPPMPFWPPLPFWPLLFPQPVIFLQPPTTLCFPIPFGLNFFSASTLPSVS